MESQKNSAHILARHLITPDGISRNRLLSRETNGKLQILPFERETHSTSFADIAATVDALRITDALLQKTEFLYRENCTPESIHEYLQEEGVLSANGAVMTIGTQSIIIEM